MTKRDIITVAIAGDLNGDGVIDFEEFMKHFTDVLNQIEFHNVLAVEYEKIASDEKEKFLLLHLDLTDVGKRAQEEADWLKQRSRD